MLVNSGKDVFVVEGVDGSNPSNQLRAVDSLGLDGDGGNESTALNLNLTTDRQSNGHMDYNVDGEAHVRGNEELIGSHVQGALEVHGVASAKLFPELARVVHQWSNLFPDHLACDLVKVVEHG